MLLDADGFDHYGGSIANMLTYGVIAEYGSVTTLETTNKRTGTHGVYLNSNNNRNGGKIRRPIPAGARNVIGSGFSVYMPELPAESHIIGCRFKDTDNQMVSSVTINTDGRLTAWRKDVTFASGGAQLATSVLPVTFATAHQHVEVRMARSLTVGSIRVQVDGVPVEWTGGVSSGGLLENVNTAGTTKDYTQVQLGGNDESTLVNAGNARMYCDDWNIWDALGDYNNDFLGDQQLHWRSPTADTLIAIAEWLASSGTDLFAMIDETNPSAADYIRALAANKQAAFAFADLPSDITEVCGIVAYCMAKKLTAGVASLELGIETNGAIGDMLYQATGPTIALSTNSTMYRGVRETSPDTLLPFLPAEVNLSNLYLDRVL